MNYLSFGSYKIFGDKIELRIELTYIKAHPRENSNHTGESSSPGSTSSCSSNHSLQYLHISNGKRL